jgi:dephospho-CoA kinase
MRRVILISGCQGSGKTTLANDLKLLLLAKLYHPVLTKFAAPIYLLHDSVKEVLKKCGIDPKPLDGTLMQLLGGHIRSTYGEDTFLNIVEAEIIRAMYVLRSIVVVDDLRYLNEIEVWDRNDCVLVRLECPESIRKARAEKWRDNTEHPSETELCQYRNWDIRLDTSGKRVPGKHASEVFKCLMRL